MKGEGSILKDLQPFFNPRSVLIIGVSRQALSFSYTVLKNLLEIFYKGRLYWKVEDFRISFKRVVNHPDDRK